MLDIEILTQLNEGAESPVYASSGAAGADVRAHIDKPMLIKVGQRLLIPTGISLAIPDGFEIQVRPRSGLALKHGVTILNTPGTIDSDYRGEISVIMINHGTENFEIDPGMRIAQLVCTPVVNVCYKQAPLLTATARGEQGFGHTGTI